MRKSCTQLDFVCLGGQYYGLGQSNIHVSHELAVVILLLAASDLEKIIFDNNIVGLKILNMTSWKVPVASPWLADTKNNGKSIDKKPPETT